MISPPNIEHLGATGDICPVINDVTDAHLFFSSRDAENRITQQGKHRTTQHSTVQNSTSQQYTARETQNDAAQHSAEQHVTAQHSTAETLGSDSGSTSGRAASKSRCGFVPLRPLGCESGPPALPPCPRLASAPVRASAYHARLCANDAGPCPCASGQPCH